MVFSAGSVRFRFTLRTWIFGTELAAAAISSPAAAILREQRVRRAAAELRMRPLRVEPFLLSKAVVLVLAPPHLLAPRPARSQPAPPTRSRHSLSKLSHRCRIIAQLRAQSRLFC